MWPFGKRLNYFSGTPTLPLKGCNILQRKIHYCSSAKMTETHLTYWHYMYFFPEMWDTTKHEADIADECSITLRKIKPIIHLIPPAQDFLYQTLMSQHGPSLQMEYSHPLHEPDNSTALPDSLHRMTQSASRQQMMDGLKTRLEKTLTTLSNDQWTNSALAIMMQLRPIFHSACKENDLAGDSKRKW